jgi:hypothetical protein
MVLRYIAGATADRPCRRTTQQQAEELLQVVLGIGSRDNHDMLLSSLKKYPPKVINACQDHMGNSILHLVLSWSIDDETIFNDNKTENTASTTKPNRRTRTRRRPTPAETDQRATTLLQIVRYLSQSIDDGLIPDDGTNVESDKVLAYSRQEGVCNSLLQKKSACGTTPLHLACRLVRLPEEQQLDIVQFMVETYPQAVQSRDSFGNVPLHEACDCDVGILPIEIILVLIAQYPESVRLRNSDGNLPLHLIVTSKPSLGRSKSDNEFNDMTAEVGERTPVAVTSSKDSNIPSLQKQRQFEIVEYLVRYWPESVNIVNSNGETALEIAMKSDNNVSVVEFLEFMVGTTGNVSSEQAAILHIQDTMITENNGNDSITSNDPMYKPINPFDDDCEAYMEHVQKTLDVSKLQSEFPDLFKPHVTSFSEDCTDEDSESEFAGVVELAADYFEVVVDRIDFDDEYLRSLNQGSDCVKIGASDSYDDFLNITQLTSDSIESGERFVSPFG